MPFDFLDGSGPVPKLFVVLGHLHGSAVALKTTSKLQRYGDKPHLRPGVVFSAATPVEPFVLDTIIDPSSSYAIPHEDLRIHHARGRIQIWTGPDDLKSRLCAAITGNPTLTKARKAGLLRCLEC